jgi:hypothetical protein
MEPNSRNDATPEIDQSQEKRPEHISSHALAALDQKLRVSASKYGKSPVSEAILYQRLIMIKALDPKISAISLATLIRAWDVLEERKRILRGRPLPGQLRPDLDPVQLAKAAKRAKARMPHDIPGSGYLDPQIWVFYIGAQKSSINWGPASNLPAIGAFRSAVKA